MPRRFLLLAFLPALLLAACESKPPKGAIPFTEPAAGQFRIAYRGGQFFEMEFFNATDAMAGEWMQIRERKSPPNEVAHTALLDDEIIPAAPTLWPESPPLNPRHWTVLTLDGAAHQVSFPHLVWIDHIVEGPNWMLRSETMPLKLTSEHFPSSSGASGLAFALAYRPAVIPKVRVSQLIKESQPDISQTNTIRLTASLQPSAKRHIAAILDKYDPMHAGIRHQSWFSDPHNPILFNGVSKIQWFANIDLNDGRQIAASFIEDKNELLPDHVSNFMPMHEYLKPSIEKHMEALLEIHDYHNEIGIFRQCWSSAKIVLKKGKEPQTVWLTTVVLNDYRSFCAIFVEEQGELRIYDKAQSERSYQSCFFQEQIVAAVDLDGDGVDELVTSVHTTGMHHYEVYKLLDGLAAPIFSTTGIGT